MSNDRALIRDPRLIGGTLSLRGSAAAGDDSDPILARDARMMDALGVPRIPSRAAAPASRTNSAPRIGLGRAEVERFVRELPAAIEAEVDPHNRALAQRAGFVREASKAEADRVGGSKYGGIVIPSEISGIGAVRAGQNMLDDSAGGFLRDRNAAPTMLDVLRARSAVWKLAEIRPAGPGEYLQPRIDTGASGAWLDENDSAAQSTQAVGLLTGSPRTASANAYLTRAMRKQANPSWQLGLLGDLAAALAETTDRGFLTGVGGRAQPVGILNWPGIGEVYGGDNGAAPSWNHVIQLQALVAAGNADVSRCGFLTNSKMAASLRRTPEHPTAATGGWIWQPYPGVADGSVGLVAGYPAHVSNLVPDDLTKGSSAGVCSAVVFADWSQILVLTWGSVELIVNDKTYSAKGGLEIDAFVDVDLLVLRSAAVSVMLDALEAA